LVSTRSTALSSKSSFFCSIATIKSIKDAKL
jgi:hypothetical protein